MANKDYYKILGVDKKASTEEIKTAFRKMAHKHHPDKGGDEEKFKEVNEAYQVLGNENKRQQYDQFGSNFAQGQTGGFSGSWGGFDGGIDVDLGDIFSGFSDIFGFGGGSSQSQRTTRGRDLEIGLELSFLEAAFGLEKEISFPKQVTCDRCQGNGSEPGHKIETCPTCNGQGFVVGVKRTILGNIQSRVACSTCQGEGKVIKKKCSKCGGSGLYQKQVKMKIKIPAGINTGESIRYQGQGEAGLRQAPAGDLYVRIKVNPHPKFRRVAYDIRSEEEILIRQAVLGDRITVETIHGPVKLKIPEGTQSGTVFKLKDKGIKRPKALSQGHHYVKIKVNIPKKLSKEQRKQVAELEI